MKMVEVEFRCVKCGRIVFEEVPEDTDTDKLVTNFEHDFDCSELAEFDEDE